MLVLETTDDAAKDKRTAEKARELASKHKGYSKVMDVEELEAEGIDYKAQSVKLPPRDTSLPPIKFAFTLFVSPNDPLWRIHR